MTDLVAFLTARLDEDEAVARASVGDPSWSREPHSGRWRSAADGCTWGAVDDDEGGVIVFDEGAPSEAQAAHIARHDPARVLREVEAKRRMLADLLAEVHADEARLSNEFGGPWTDSSDLLLRLLAAPYSDHPDFREEWAP